MDAYGTLTISGGTISNNAGTDTGGISVRGASNMTDVIISDNTSSGVFVYYCDLTMTNVTISGNTAENGGGVYVAGDSTISGGTIRDNTAENGGGVYVNEIWINMISGEKIYTHLVLANGDIRNNTTTGNGGGVYVGDTVTMSGGTITSNTASGVGGGVYVVDNYAEEELNLASGTAINISGNTKTDNSANNIFYDNTANIFPVKLTGNITIASGTKIGLSPTNKNSGDILVEKTGGIINASDFSLDAGGNVTVDSTTGDLVVSP